MVDATAHDADKVWDVVIVGSGFAGALIANELGKARKQVLILEAGARIPTNINDYMTRFYKASAKVPESPYTPEIFDDKGLIDPATVNAGRPTVLSLGAKGKFGDWTDPKTSYLVQVGKTPFASTYDRVAGGTQHWLGTSLRFVPNDFRMRSAYGQFVDWPIGYQDLACWYDAAEAEIGVSGAVADQEYLGIKIGKDYPMQPIPQSMVDQYVDASLNGTPLTDAETGFLGMGKPVANIPVRSLPAARNSEPYRNRRACAGNTNCIPICPIQAKYDPTVSLNDALSTGFVKMMDRTVANDIVVGENGRITQINFLRYQHERGPKSEAKPGSVRAKAFVIAANAIETARLLLMSRDRKGIANSSGMVGQHLMDHPYYVSWGLVPKPIYPYRGPLITSGIGDLCDGPFRRERGAFRVDIGNEGWNFVVGGDPNISTVDFVNGLNRTGTNPSADALFGKELATKLNNIFTRQFRVGFLVEQTPEPGNKVTLHKNLTDGLGLPRPEVSYSLSDYTKKGIVASYRMKKLMFSKMGIIRENEFTNVGDDNPMRFDEVVDGETVKLNYTGAGHIMGTYRMGADKSHSVVNDMQQSWDHANLYLVGSGTFPTGATANPTLTIAALSLRTADHLIKRVL
ncbi:GMC family oxidoreductase, partial [Bradyrhizobium sp. LTSP885]|uniref:GMC family oxidoreductase n=1 Tax=Bradyrhizobium sp. LTSP885 TaxID=1619232 RepID=UPI0005CB6399